MRRSHVLQTPHRRVAADSVVIWTDDGLTWRLEGTAELDELVEIAGQLAVEVVESSRLKKSASDVDDQASAPRVGDT